MLNLLRNGLFSALDSNDSNDFVRALKKIASEIQGRPTLVRSRPIYTQADSIGAYWEYPPAENIQDYLHGLHQFFRNKAILSPVFKATVAIVVLNSVHPFSDGNGRIQSLCTLVRADACGTSSILRLWFGADAIQYSPTLSRINVGLINGTDES